jgi:fatty acid synthase
LTKSRKLKELNKNTLNELINEILENPEYDLSKDVINMVSKNERFIRPLLDIVYENNCPKKEIKVTEINLSNAIMAAEVDNYLASASIIQIKVDYTIVNKSIDRLPENLKNETFKLIEWNTDKSIFSSELLPVDLLIIKDTFDLWDVKSEDFLKQVYNTVTDKGFLLTVFRYKLTEPEHVLHEICEESYTNGLKLEQRITQFVIEAQKNGFNIICRKSDSIGSIAILFRKVLALNQIQTKDQDIIVINNNYEQWFDVLKQKLNEHKDSDKQNDNIWLIANDEQINGIIGLTLCLRQEPGGDKIRCLFDMDQKLQFPVNFSEKPFSQILINDLAFNVLRNDKLGTYRHITLPKLRNQVETNDYFLNFKQVGDLSSLQWFDCQSICSPKTIILMDTAGHDYTVNQIRCNIYYSGINFRDVMIASGIY